MCRKTEYIISILSRNKYKETNTKLNKPEVHIALNEDIKVYIVERETIKYIQKIEEYTVSCVRVIHSK